TAASAPFFSCSPNLATDPVMGPAMPILIVSDLLPHATSARATAAASTPPNHIRFMGSPQVNGIQSRRRLAASAPRQPPLSHSRSLVFSSRHPGAQAAPPGNFPPKLWHLCHISPALGRVKTPTEITLRNAARASAYSPTQVPGFLAK